MFQNEASSIAQIFGLLCYKKARYFEQQHSGYTRKSRKSHQPGNRRSGKFMADFAREETNA